MFIITDNNSNAIINTRGERKIKIKQSYHVGKNIQSVGYTQNSGTIKKVTQLKKNHTRRGYAQQLSIER